MKKVKEHKLKYKIKSKCHFRKSEKDIFVISLWKNKRNASSWPVCRPLQRCLDF